MSWRTCDSPRAALTSSFSLLTKENTQSKRDSHICYHRQTLFFIQGIQVFDIDELIIINFLY